MTIDPQIIALTQALGPPLLAIVGTVLAVILSIMGGLARAAWKAHQGRMDAMATALRTLAEGVSKESAENHGDHKKVWEAVQGLRAELEMNRRSSENIRTGLVEVTGTVKGQQGIIVELIEKLSAVSGKLEAVFRFVDAPRRATDP